MDIKSKLYILYEKAVRCIFPKHCPVCNKIIPLNEEYCSCSRQDSRRIGDNYCHHCAREIYNCTCESRNTVILPESASVYVYGGKVRADILDLKFNNEKHLAEKLGSEMAERCAVVYSDIDFDIVTFVPMTKEAYSERGYNQSQLLAEKVGELLFVPVEDLLVKTRQTRVQHELGGNDRLENVKNSVRLKDDILIKGKNILICDDVKTTGATLNQCVQALEKGCADKVCCITAAISDFS